MVDNKVEVVGLSRFSHVYLTFCSPLWPIDNLIMKKKNTEFYLLRKKSLSEADLFVTDYIKTKQRLEILESEFSTLQSFVRNQEIYFNEKKKH